MHEVVTIQLGQQANYVGTHYWNTQESYFTYAGDEESPIDHDVSFRPGIGVDGSETYTPRTLIYDLKGAFGSLRRENALYRLEEQMNASTIGQWQGNAAPMHLPRIEPSRYQEALDQGVDLPTLTVETVRFWSDYNHVFYHPRSIIQVNEYELNSSLLPFEQWQNGEELFANLDREHDLLDRDLRPFLEECDQLQAIQVLSSTDNAWGGFCSRYMERIADELGKGSRWVFGFQDTRRTALDRQRVQLANLSQSLYALSNSTSMHIPLANVPLKLPAYLSLNGSSQWQTAALQAVALESITLPTRIRRSLPEHATYDTLETTLGNDGKRPIASCAFSVNDVDSKTVTNGHHDSNTTNGLIEEDADENDESLALDIDLNPDFSAGQSNSRRGEHRRTRLFSKFECRRGFLHVDTDDDDDHNSGRTRNRHVQGPRTLTTRASLPFPVLSSYPKIFRLDASPPKLAVHASLSTSSAISRQIKSLEGITRRLIGVDEREALSDGLATMAQEYEEGWSSDEDSDDE